MPVYKARPKDIDDLLALAEIWDQEEENLHPTNPQKLENYIHDNMVYLYREDREDEVLAAMIIDETYDTINLKTFYVHPDYRSEGIGKNMMDGFTNMLDQGCMKAFLEVEKHNPAISLYKRFGFKEHPNLDTIDGHIAMSREPD